MKNSWSNIMDSGDFTDQINRIQNISEKALLITADMIGLFDFPSISHNVG